MGSLSLLYTNLSLIIGNIISYFGDKISLSLSRTNSPLLRIHVFEPYEIWILGDPWINVMCVISSLIYLSITNFSYAVGWLVGGLGIPDEV